MDDVSGKLAEPKSLYGIKRVLWVCLGSSLLFSGCATYRVYAGFPATDLSGFHCGMPRGDVEKILGGPEKVEEGEQGTVAYYPYDRGYIPPAENWSDAKYLAVPVVILLEISSLGMLEIGVACQSACTKGRLEVRYNAVEELVVASEHRIPADEHSFCGRGTKNARSCDISGSRARPSTLPNLGEGACQRGSAPGNRPADGRSSPAQPD